MPRVVFIERNGARLEIDAEEGTTVLDAARRVGADLPGSCEGALSCSTCHVIVEPDWFDALGPSTPDEEDALDMAASPTRTSRLACRLTLAPDLDGLTVRIPPVSSTGG